MSSTRQGEGWWRATDGKWYPPDQAPAGDWERSPDGVWRAALGAPEPPLPGTPGRSGLENGLIRLDGRRRLWPRWGQALFWVLLPFVALAAWGATRPVTQRNPLYVASAVVLLILIAVGLSPTDSTTSGNETAAPTTATVVATTTTSTSTTTTTTTTSTTTTSTVPAPTTTADPLANLTRAERQQLNRFLNPPPAPPPQPVASNCDPNYTPCVPRHPPDVNCSDLGGPVQVIGSDPHGLDRDGDGSACES